MLVERLEKLHLLTVSDSQETSVNSLLSIGLLQLFPFKDVQEQLKGEGRESKS